MKQVTTATAHKCHKCGQMIPIGTRCYTLHAGLRSWQWEHIVCPAKIEVTQVALGNQMTNLQACGGSTVAAFEVFDKISPNESFAVWCDAKATPKPKTPEPPVWPAWVCVNAWFEHKEYKGKRQIRKIEEAQITDNLGGLWSPDKLKLAVACTPPLPEWVKPRALYTNLSGELGVVFSVDTYRFISYSGVTYYSAEIEASCKPLGMLPDWVELGANCHRGSHNYVISRIDYEKLRVGFTNDEFASFMDVVVHKELASGHVEPPLPEWVKPGQWIQMKNITNGSTYVRRIARVNNTYVHYTGTPKGSYGNYDLLWCVLANAVPMTIKPWTLAELDQVMTAHTDIILNGNHEHIYEVRRTGNSAYANVKFASGLTVYTNEIAQNAETADHKPCGTPVPM